MSTTLLLLITFLASLLVSAQTHLFQRDGYYTTVLILPLPSLPPSSTTTTTTTTSFNWWPYPPYDQSTNTDSSSTTLSEYTSTTLTIPSPSPTPPPPQDPFIPTAFIPYFPIHPSPSPSPSSPSLSPANTTAPHPLPFKLKYLTPLFVILAVLFSATLAGFLYRKWHYSRGGGAAREGYGDDSKFEMDSFLGGGGGGGRGGWGEGGWAGFRRYNAQIQHPRRNLSAVQESDELPYTYSPFLNQSLPQSYSHSPPTSPSKYSKHGSRYTGMAMETRMGTNNNNTIDALSESIYKSLHPSSNHSQAQPQARYSEIKDLENGAYTDIKNLEGGVERTSSFFSRLSLTRKSTSSSPQKQKQRTDSSQSPPSTNINLNLSSPSDPTLSQSQSHTSIRRNIASRLKLGTRRWRSRGKEEEEDFVEGFVGRRYTPAPLPVPVPILATSSEMRVGVLVGPSTSESVSASVSAGEDKSKLMWMKEHKREDKEEEEKDVFGGWKVETGFEKVMELNTPSPATPLSRHHITVPPPPPIAPPPPPPQTPTKMYNLPQLQSTTPPKKKMIEGGGGGVKTRVDTLEGKSPLEVDRKKRVAAPTTTTPPRMTQTQTQIATTTTTVEDSPSIYSTQSPPPDIERKKPTTPRKVAVEDSPSIYSTQSPPPSSTTTSTTGATSPFRIPRPGVQIPPARFRRAHINPIVPSPPRAALFSVDKDTDPDPIMALQREIASVVPKLKDVGMRGSSVSASRSSGW